MRRYIITDPCYLINDDAAWRRYCDLIFDDKGYMNADNGNSIYMSEECDCEDDY